MALMSVGLLSFNNLEEVKLVIITNDKGAPEQIPYAELKAIFRGEKPRWNDGNKVRIALMKPRTEIGTITARKIYNMSSNELNKYWLALVFQGRTSPPKFFAYEEDLKKYVLETEGAIGILNNSTLVPKNNIVYIDGASSIE